MSSKKRGKKIKVEAVARATPVSRFREKYRDKSKQTTLTQLLGSDSDTDDNFIVNKKRSTFIKKGRRKVVDLFESSDSETDSVPEATIVTPPPKSLQVKRYRV